VPGHEIAGRIDAVGADVTLWKPGQRVGVGWHGGHCLVCDACRRGDFMLRQNEKITGIPFDGGYAEYTVAPAEAVAALPDDLPAADCPLLCAGITVFNARRNAGVRSGELVAFRASVAWAISEFNTRARWVFAPSRSAAVRIENRWL
jgi:D-arabinose 1-dehydrogenase-like Zn-dependent alcohol dehydrogenase